MTKDNEKIKEFITEYRDFLAANNIDVAHSAIEDTWFIYQFQQDYGYYNFFIQFSTVTQLVDIILDEMKFELYCAVQKEVSPPPYDDNLILDIIENYSPSKNTIPELTILLDMILSSEYGKDSRFFQTLDKLFTRSSRNKKSKMK